MGEWKDMHVGARHREGSHIQHKPLHTNTNQSLTSIRRYIAQHSRHTALTDLHHHELGPGPDAVQHVQNEAAAAHEPHAAGR